MGRTKAFRLACWCLPAGALLPGPVRAQVSPALTRVFGDQQSSFLFKVKAAAVDEVSLAVLTDPDPAVHVYSAGDSREWGGAGGGPGELASPVDIEWTEGSIFVLDVGIPKFVRYDERGTFVASRPTEGFRARRMWVRGGDTILSTFAPMTDARAAVRLRGEQADTLFAYSKRGASIRLEADGAPSFTVKPPYVPQIIWTVLSDGGLVRYDPSSNEMEWLSRDGRILSSTPVTWERIRLTSDDRRWWIDSTIPEEFMGQRVFEPLRAVARETLEFPERLPSVLAALSDSDAGAWFRRTTPVNGERWVLVGRDGQVRGEVALPAGRQLLVAGEMELFALASDDLGVETIEAFKKPDWALP